MKKLSVFETSVLGFFIGVVIATYISFLAGAEGYTGKLLTLVSLQPVLDSILSSSPAISDTQTSVVAFLFFVLVFTLYGTLVGLGIKFMQKPKFLIIAMCLVVVGISAEQTFGHFRKDTRGTTQIATVSQSIPSKKVSKQSTYFGMEAWGDLNGDNVDDVAFIIHRSDLERGMLYYLTTALTTESGKAGTNLIFLGDKVVPEMVTIENLTVRITLTPESESEDAIIGAHIVEGELVKIDSVELEKDPQFAPSI